VIAVDRTLRSVASLVLLGCLAGSVVTTSAACTAFETNLQDTEVSYQETAKQNFDAGEKSLEEHRNNEAIKFFEHVKAKYPYSKYAVLAELKIADAHFAREKWLEAADAYRIFVRFHPRHEQVAYASFRGAVAYYREIDEDIPLLPKSREKDQSATRDAIRAFDDYLQRFPNDEHAVEAKEMRLKARTKLADSDLYAAEFYAQREKWKGAIGRYNRIATEFSDTELAPAALLTAGDMAREKLADTGTARGLYERLLKEHPQAREAILAKRHLDALPSTSPPPPPPQEAEQGSDRPPTPPPGPPSVDEPPSATESPAEPPANAP
jgi:outer membrane protein assembly factor BamD